MIITLRALGALTLSLCLSFVSFAQLEDETENPIFNELKGDISFDDFGTSINLYNGRYSTLIPALSVPGNSDLFVGVYLQPFPEGRLKSPEPFALPMITGVLPCAYDEPVWRDYYEDLGESDQTNSGQSYGVQVPHSGMYLHIPGRVPERMGVSGQTLGNYYHTCTDTYPGPNSPENAPNFSMTRKVHTPDGKIYTFDQMNDPDFVEFGHGILYASKVEDAHGNTVTYSHNQGRITSVSASDGRAITFSYTGSDNQNSAVTTISTNGRIWRWRGERSKPYGGSVSATSTKRFELPDGTEWRFSSTGTSTRRSTGACDNEGGSFTISTPMGATLLLNITNTVVFSAFHTSSAGGKLPSQSQYQCSNYANTIFANQLRRKSEHGMVTKATITAPHSQTSVWDIDYEVGWGRSVPANALTASFEVSRTLTKPDSSQIVYYYESHATSTYITTLKRAEIKNSGGQTVARYTPEFEYGRLVLNPHGDDRGAVSGGTSSRSRQLLLKHADIAIGADSYSTDYQYNESGDWDLYNLPTRIERSASLHSDIRIEERAYQNLSLSDNGLYRIGLPSKVTRNGKVFSENTYNSSLGLLSSTKTFGVTTSTYAYHSDGMLKSITDALGRVTEYTNYKRGTPQTEKAAKGSSAEATTNRTVDNNGWVVSETNPRGVTFTHSYDNMGRQTLINRPGSWSNTTISYGSLGNGLTSTSTRGNSRTVTTYDGFMRPTLVKSDDLTGHSPSRYVKSAYDYAGRTTFTSWPSTLANPTTGVETTFDALGRVTQVRENVSPFATTTTAYLSGNQVRVTDPSGAQTTTTYRAFGAPATNEAMTVVDATGTTTTMTRDIHGNIENINQSSGLNGHTVNVDRKFWYDSRFRLCRHHAPELGDELFAYDNADQLTMSSRGEATGSGCGTPSSSIRTAFTYDAMGRQTLINFPSGTADISKTYDANSNVLTTNRGGINWTYAYNDLDLMTSEQLVIDGITFNVGHGFDTTGNRSSLTYPYGSPITYSPNGFGEPTLIKTWDTYVSNISYHPNGVPYTASYGNGKWFAQSLNPRQRIYDTIVDGAGGRSVHLRHSYDVRGKVSNITNYAVSGQNRSFTYDARGRLVTASGPWGSGSFEYDGLDNVRKKTLGSRIVEIQYNSANRVSLFKDTGVMNIWQSMSYDARGNVKDTGTLSLGGKDLVYDWANQPITLTGSGISNTYTYDGNLKRVKSVQDGKTTYWIYSAVTGTLVYADEVTDNIKTRYISGAGVQVRLKDGTPEYTHLDHQGSPITATDDVGNLEWREHYTPFGEKWQSDFANDNDIGYTGHVQDHASGLTYMQARYYDPVIGRFLSTDPIGYQDQMNLYAYVRNDPVNMVDPDGRITVFIGGAGDKNGHRNVQTYANRAQAANPERTIAYFGEHQGADATNFINNELASGNNEPVNIVGHSYGAATAVEVANGVDGTVNTLVGVDPVGKPNIPNTTSAPSNVINVVTVNNNGKGDIGGELAEHAGKVTGGVPDAFEETSTQLDNEFGHSTFGPAYEHDSLPYGSAKEIVDETYR